MLPFIHNGKTVVDNKEKANIFNNYFNNQSTVDDTSTDPLGEPPAAKHKISNTIIEPPVIYIILKNLNTNKATGPDGLGNKILKEAAPALAEPLCKLFNMCLTAGQIPDVWKEAHVIPLHKQLEKTNCSNYRPISLLPCISEVFEKNIFRHMYAFLKQHDLISEKQSGFIPGDSTTNQLLKNFHELAQALGTGDEIRAVFLDLSKAFDKVWHSGLIYKLKAIGISGLHLKLIKSYLSNRRQRVVLNNGLSTWKIIPSGVPQGSVLGQLLFLVYINDHCDDIQSDIYLFADDSSLFKKIFNCSIAATNILNKDLLTISRWAKKWLISINPIKSKAMLFSRKRKKSPEHSLYLDGTCLNNVKSHKHLGLELSSDLSWSLHIETICSKSRQRLALLKSCKLQLNRYTLNQCYISYVRPLLEYANIVFDNCTEHDKSQLENIQYKALLLITGAKQGTSYELLIEETGFQTLNNRRTMQKLLKFHKLVHTKDPVYLSKPLPNTLGNERATRASKTHTFTLIKTNTIYFSNSFFPDCVRLWNSLNKEIRSIQNYEIFKIKNLKYTNYRPNPHHIL